MLNSSKFNKPTSARNYNAGQLEDVSWDRHTFKLPVALPNSATAHPAIKDRYYRATIDGVAASHQAPALTKINVLSSRFEFPHLIHEIDGSLTQLYDNTTGTDSNIVVTENPLIFQLSRPSLRNDKGDEIPMPLPNAANLANNVCRNTRFYAFQLLVSPRNAYQGPQTIRDTVSLDDILFSAAITMPSVIIDDIETIPNVLTANILRDARQTLTVLTQLNNGTAPLIGTLSKPAGQFFVSLQPPLFRSEFMNFFHLCRYKLFRELLRNEFLGKALVDTSFVVNELQSMRQNRWDNQVRRFIVNTVEEYYGSFMSTVNLLPHNTLYPVDLAMLFWNGLNNDIRQQGEAADTPYLPPSRPQGEVESNQQADSRLRSVKDAATRFENNLIMSKHKLTKLEVLSITGVQPTCFLHLFTLIHSFTLIKLLYSTKTT
jgi:hypothetical protein